VDQSLTVAPIRIRIATETDVSAVARLMAAEAEELAVYDPTVELNRGFDWTKLAQIQIRKSRSHLTLAESPEGVVGLMQTLLVGTGSNRSMSHLPQRILRGLFRRAAGKERDLVHQSCHGRIEHVFVLPGHRRLHPAVLLYRDALRWLRLERADFVEGVVHERNQVIKSLAARSGFEPVRVMMRRSV